MPQPKTPRLAYIDGGLAAFLAQAAIASFLGVMWVLKGYWYQIKAYFSGGASGEAGNPAQSEQEE